MDLYKRHQWLEREQHHRGQPTLTLIGSTSQSHLTSSGATNQHVKSNHDKDGVFKILGALIFLYLYTWCLPLCTVCRSKGHDATLWSVFLESWLVLT